MFHWAFNWGSYITRKLQYSGFQQNILYSCNISILVEAALLVISGASNRPSSCLWYDEWSTELSLKYPTSLESYDRQDCNSTSNIFVISVHQSKWPLQWSLVHWMIHLAACDMMRGPPSFCLNILHQWKAMISRMPSVYHIYCICNLRVSVKVAPLMISGALNGPSNCLWYNKGTTELLLEYSTSMESCDMQESNSTSYTVGSKTVAMFERFGLSAMQRLI